VGCELRTVQIATDNTSVCHGIMTVYLCLRNAFTGLFLLVVH